MTTLEAYINRRQTRINLALKRWLPNQQVQPKRLHEAMHYAVQSGGKRIRPLLVYAAGEAFGTPLGQLDAPAAAIELIHTYSLVHDDLPAMDDDDYRRKKPTCHRAFDEATAILVGDALQSLAFELLSSKNTHQLDATSQLAMLNVLASASGSLGMAGGQALDLQAIDKDINIDALEMIHRYKTGALLQASVCLGALSANNVDPLHYQQLQQYGAHIGLAFQIQDDLFDIDEATTDSAPNYAQLLGESAAERKVQQLHQLALAQLDNFDDRIKSLRQLTLYLLKRNH